MSHIAQIWATRLTSRWESATQSNPSVCQCQLFTCLPRPHVTTNTATPPPRQDTVSITFHIETFLLVVVNPPVAPCPPVGCNPGLVQCWQAEGFRHHWVAVSAGGAPIYLYIYTHIYLFFQIAPHTCRILKKRALNSFGFRNTTAK